MDGEFRLSSDVGVGKGKDAVSISYKSERCLGGGRSGDGDLGQDDGESLGGEEVYAANVFMLCDCVDGDL